MLRIYLLILYLYGRCSFYVMSSMRGSSVLIVAICHLMELVACACGNLQWMSLNRHLRRILLPCTKSRLFIHKRLIYNRRCMGWWYWLISWLRSMSWIFIYCLNWRVWSFSMHRFCHLIYAWLCIHWRMLLILL